VKERSDVGENNKLGLNPFCAALTNFYQKYLLTTMASIAYPSLNLESNKLKSDYIITNKKILKII
jgi:hypothetical protein